MRTSKPSHDVEIWLARQAVANATMDLPDVDGFMQRFGDALTNAVRKMGLEAAYYAYADALRNQPTMYPEKWATTCFPPHSAGKWSSTNVLRDIFTVWYFGLPKSRLAREFIINTCRAAMTAGV